MSNTLTFAQNELNILSQSSSDPSNRPIVEPFITEILALCEKVGNSGQSGGSAPYTAKALSQTIENLLLQKPICPITNLEDEWIDIAEVGDGSILYQNKRCSALFKQSDGKAYYIDAIAWKTQNGSMWSGTAAIPYGNTAWIYCKKILSRAFVKSFPFEPKTFYVDVIEKEVAKDDWEFYIKDESQLNEVFEYYDKYYP